MDQKQLDDLESKEREDDSLEENNLSQDDKTSSEESAIPEETEEKRNDVNEIIESDDKAEENKEEPKPDDSEKEKTETESSSPEAEKTAEKKDSWDWDDEDEEPKPGRTWKVISGILVILLIIAIYTNGFNFSGGPTGAAAVSLTQIEAEEKVADYINTNLLRAPFTAEVKSSEELGNLFKITLEVAGQTVDAYLTKDGKYFFPQGFDLEAPPPELEAPSPGEAELVDVSVDDDPVKGDPAAKVTIIEFSEFQCPFCKRYVDETYPQIIREYVDTGKVKYVFRDFPLAFHPQAKPAAMASECAHEQGKYWEYHDLLFENQADLGLENFKKWAAELDLDTGQFNDCLDNEKYLAEVEKDLVEGQSYGVTGTPAFFINGRMISGAQPYVAFEQAIEAAFQALAETEEPTAPEAPEEPAPEAEVAEPAVEETPEAETAEPAVEETETQPAPGTPEIQVVAKKWRFDPKRLEVNQGDQVKLIITSADVEHSFELPEFQISEIVPAQGAVEIEFTAGEKGTFNFKSNSNPVMTGTLTVK